MAMLHRDKIRQMGSSVFNYWFGYVSNLGLVIFLCSRAWQDGRLRLGVGAFAALAGGGLLLWTLCEYLLHRYVYHVWPSFLSTGHDLHHQAPRDKIGVPWYLTLVILLAIYYGLAAGFDPAATGVVMGFVWLGYIGYCITHHGSHHWPCKLPWLRQMKRHHMVHHAFPDTNWGFTTSLWDHVFGTFCAPKRGGTAAGRERSRHPAASL